LIEGVDLSGITTVIPLLVTRDDIGDGFYVNSYLDLRFQDAKRDLSLSSAIAPVHCTKLLCISVDIIEKISPYLCDTRLGAILGERLTYDPALAAPFFLKPTPTITSNQRFSSERTHYTTILEQRVRFLTPICSLEASWGQR